MLEQLKKDYKEAMIEKDTNRKNTIQMIRANITNLAKYKRVTELELTEEDMIGVVTRELKQQKDSLEAFTEGKRADLVEKTEENIKVLMEYLPKQMTREEVENTVKETIKELGISDLEGKNRGILMGRLMPKVKGKADGKLVNEIVVEYSDMVDMQNWI